MLIKGIEWQGVAVPFKRPFLTSASSIQTRYSLVVRLETDTGIFGLGEAPASFIRSPASLPSGPADPVASRLNDARMVTEIPITAPDYRQTGRARQEPRRDVS